MERAVGHRELPKRFPQIMRDLVDQGIVVPLSKRGKITGYIVPASFKEVIAQAERTFFTDPILMAQLSSAEINDELEKIADKAARLYAADERLTEFSELDAGEWPYEPTVEG